MKKHHSGDDGLSCFDVKNEKLNADLKNYKTSKGKERDRLGRILMQNFCEFVNESRQTDIDGSGVHPDLLSIASAGIQMYATGASFDLHVGGQSNKPKNGRPTRFLRNQAIRLSVQKNIVEGSDVLAAATLTSEQLAIGEVDGLPVVTLTPSAVRSIWYHAPLALIRPDKQDAQKHPDNPLIESNNFQELKEACFLMQKAYEAYTPTILKFIIRLTGVSGNKIAKLHYAINAIAQGAEPNDAFKYQKD